MTLSKRGDGVSITSPVGYISAHTARVGAGVLIPGFLRDFGVDADEFFRALEIDPGLLQDPDNAIPYVKNAEIYSAAARVTSRENFGVMVGISAGLHYLGPLGAEMRKCKTIFAAWKRCSEAFHLQARGASIEIVREGDSSLLRYIITDPTVESGGQISAGAIAFATSVMRELYGPGWRAKSVELPLRQVRNVAPFQAAFSCPVRFDSPYAVLRFDSDWLTRAPYNQIAEAPVSLPKAHDSVSDSVQEVCAKRLVTGSGVDSSAVARAMGMSRRTLYRRLAEENATYQHIIQTERLALAKRLLHDTDISITTVGLIVGYSEASAFSRAFHNWFGYTPRQARVSSRALYGRSVGTAD